MEKYGKPSSSSSMDERGVSNGAIFKDMPQSKLHGLIPSSSLYLVSNPVEVSSKNGQLQFCGSLTSFKYSEILFWEIAIPNQIK
eukprot:snap_masked-scaffold_31-processed-gene-1.37-mRNA-1 protein AED:1.00 eAED:1.00 QI:0/0/0/0/1/1/2/0/83